MRDFEKVLRDLGLEMEVVVVAEKTGAAGLTIQDLEGRAKGAFFIVQVDRRDGETITRPPRDLRVEAGDGLVVVGHSGSRVNAIFTAPAERPRAGRTVF
jgi:voltage-gated potassium channel